MTNIRDFTPEHKAALTAARNSRPHPTRRTITINGVTYYNRKATYDALGLNFYSLNKMLAAGTAIVEEAPRSSRRRSEVILSIKINEVVYPSKSAAYRALGIDFVRLEKMLEKGTAVIIREIR